MTSVNGDSPRVNGPAAASRLRALLARDEPVVAPGVYDCVSCLVVEAAGFPAAFVSGAAVTASVLGYPDVGLQAMPEILGQCRNMARCVSIPLIVDIDTGYGNALNLVRAIREFEQAGVAGVFFEDQAFPKRCGHFEGKKLVSADEMCVKVAAAKEARRNSDFVLIARTDARALLGLDAAIERANAYAAAGADLVFVESLLSVDEMKRAVAEINCGVQANLGEGGKTPMVSLEELTAIGFKVVSYSGTLQRTAIKGMQKVLDILKREGTTMPAFPDDICSLMERSALLRLDEFYDYEERIYGPIVETEKSWKGELTELTAKLGTHAEHGKVPQAL